MVSLLSLKFNSEINDVMVTNRSVICHILYKYVSGEAQILNMTCSMGSSGRLGNHL